MKINKIILVSIFLLAVMTLTPLCASDTNQTEDLSVDAENSVSYSSDITSTYDIIGDEEDDFDEDYEEDYEDEDDDYPFIELKVSKPSTMYENNPTTITFTGSKDLDGDLEVKIDGKTYYGDFESGKGTVKIKALTTGTKTVTYSGDLFDGYTSGNFTVNVVKKPTLKASDVTMYSSQIKTYKVQLLDADGKALAGKTVTFYQDYTKLQSVKTDSNGYASIKLKNLDVYPSNIKIKYDGVTFTKKLTVKSIFKSFKNAKVKNAKKLTVQISTKKVGGKYLKGKTVTIKVKGKKFTAKINSKGIVKLSIPQKVFAKCSTSKYAGYIIGAYLGKDYARAGIEFSKVKPTLSYKITNNIGVGGT